MAKKMSKADGTKFAPATKQTGPVVKPGEFIFAAAFLDHGHIYPMVRALLDAGGQCKYVYEPDETRRTAFLADFPGVQPVHDFEAVLQDPHVHMVAAAGVPSTRGPVGVQCMAHGKDYFVDKTPFTTLAQLEEARATVARTGRKFMVYYCERLHSEGAEYAGQLVKGGAIGNVVQVMGIGPHRLNAPSRPGWFFDRARYGGILCDIGSHQCEQFLYFTGATDAQVLHSKVRTHPNYPELETFGDCNLLGNNGASGYFRVDWLTPQALPTWGDGRLFIAGTQGFIEVRKHMNLGVNTQADHVFLCNNDTYEYINVEGKVGCRFFGDLVLDVLNRTENAMTQAHAFKAAELCLLAQEKAMII